MNAAFIIAATTITNVWLALGGHGPRHGRASTFYREGDNLQAVSLNDKKACWYDFVTGEGGGMLDLIQRVRGCDRVQALRWLSEFTGLPLDDRPATRAERRAIAERREREQREMRSAEFFRIAAENLAELILDELPEAVPERYAPTQLLLRVRSLQNTAVLALFRDWMERDPRLTAALVNAGARSWRRQCDRLARFIVVGAEANDAA